ncbi:MAG: YmdB family metallophosphoesterase [Clostridia bacterium]|nr:YmdB family metallophosphoesterase [Clostridia bacterium]
MRILAIGDVTSPSAAEYLASKLWSFREREKIDFTVVNAENAGFITGVSADIADRLLFGGADCLTGGNHTMRNKGIYTFLEENDRIIRPINFGDSVPGRGYTVLDASGVRVLVINAMGCVHIEPTLNSPFDYIEGALEAERGNYDVSVLDIHAEATGEKLALAHFFDGRIDIVFGTHTHVPTADATVLPSGTGYITDVGMCGESGGILGLDTLGVIESVRFHLPQRFSPAKGTPRADGVIFTVDLSKHRVTEIKQVEI